MLDNLTELANGQLEIADMGDALAVEREAHMRLDPIDRLVHIRATRFGSGADFSIRSKPPAGSVIGAAQLKPLFTGSNRTCLEYAVTGSSYLKKIQIADSQTTRIGGDVDAYPHQGIAEYWFCDPQGFGYQMVDGEEVCQIKELDLIGAENYGFHKQSHADLLPGDFSPQWNDGALAIISKRTGPGVVRDLEGNLIICDHSKKVAHLRAPEMVGWNNSGQLIRNGQGDVIKGQGSLNVTPLGTPIKQFPRSLVQQFINAGAVRVSVDIDLGTTSVGGSQGGSVSGWTLLSGPSRAIENDQSSNVSLNAMWFYNSTSTTADFNMSLFSTSDESSTGGTLTLITDSHGTGSDWDNSWGSVNPTVADPIISDGAKFYVAHYNLGPQRVRFDSLVTGLVDAASKPGFDETQNSPPDVTQVIQGRNRSAYVDVSLAAPSGLINPRGRLGRADQRAGSRQMI